MGPDGQKGHAIRSDKTEAHHFLVILGSMHKLHSGGGNFGKGADVPVIRGVHVLIDRKHLFINMWSFSGQF